MSEPVRMTAAEIAVMREIVKWCRENDVRETSSARWEATREVHYNNRRYGGRGVDIDLRFHGLRVAFGGGVMHDWKELPARTFTEGADMLVALGFLPARFSSAYARGWDVVMEEAEHPAAAGDAFRAILPASLVRSC